jgi:serine protease DegQ
MSSLQDLSKEIEQLVEKASKSVVRVDARRGRAGTGIVWDSGLVLTANHVVEQEDDITVVVDDKTLKASLVGRDPATDLALLKVDGLSAPAMPRAKVDGLKPGAIVLAIGRPGSLKATFGTISAVSSSWRGWRGSEIEHLIQTNAPLYPGFSGGPLVDVDGRAVGMNSWVFGRGDGRAIAMDVAERVVQSLRGGTPEPRRQGRPDARGYPAGPGRHGDGQPGGPLRRTPQDERRRRAESQAGSSRRGQRDHADGRGSRPLGLDPACYPLPTPSPLWGGVGEGVEG